jgi:isopentenyldiphosphate isomerase
MLLHPVVHLHIFNSAGELYLQKRAPGKDTHPGKWDTAVGGHLDAGETVDRALRREAKEELGLTEFVPVFIGRYIFESPVEREMVYSFRTLFDGELYPDPDELSGGRFWRMPEIRAHLHSGVFTPNFVDEYCRFTALC